MMTIHRCINKEGMLALENSTGWHWDERPLNTEIHTNCPYCELSVTDESFKPATQEQIDVLNLHYVGQEKVELLTE